MDFIPAQLAENFHFIRPAFLFGLLPAALLILLLAFLQNSQSSWNRAIDKRLLPYLLDKSSSPKQSFPLYGLLVIWILGIVALAGPAWEEIPVPVQEREDALVIVLDLSLSMYANDVTPNRIVRAQRKLIDILDYRREEGQTALVVYAGDAHAVTPMTDDVETINNLVSSLYPNIMPILGSKPAAGVALAQELLVNGGLLQGQILLITDGISESDLDAIADLMDNSLYSLSVMGVGTEEGAPIPMAEGGFLRDQQNAIVIPKLERGPLQELASLGNGRYADAQLNDSDIEFLLSQNRFEENENLVEADREFDTWNEAGPWLLLFVLPFAALAFRRGWLLALCLTFTMLPDKQAYAWGWQDLWINKDTQGSQQFAEENFDEAAQLFQDDSWRAAANYRSGNYEQAVVDLSALDTPDAHYNRGNALARLNLYEDAIAAYDAALAQAPDHADAQANKALLEELLQEQEQQNQQQQSQDGDQQDQEQQEGEQPQDQENQQQSQEQQQSEQQSDEQQEGEQENQEEQDSEQDQQQSDQESQEGEEQEQEDTEQQPNEAEQPDSEEEQAMQQWLSRIPDDPGELLRNKFRQQAQQELSRQLLNPTLAEQQGGEQIW